MQSEFIIQKSDRVVVTGAGGFLGGKVVETLLSSGFSNVGCLVRPSSNLGYLRSVLEKSPQGHSSIVCGNLLSRKDCSRICEDAAVVYHVAAASEKSFAGTFLNTAVATRNLLEAVVGKPGFRRFVNVSSLAVYSTNRLGRHQILDETCELEADPVLRNDPYCYGKLRQDEIVGKYGKDHGVPYVIVRPGPIYGPRSRAALHARIGLDTFGIFLHLGGANLIAFTFIDNCAEAVVRAGLVRGIEGEVLNIIDDDLPTSRQFLRAYKHQAHNFNSLRLPYSLFYLFSWGWEKYSAYSKRQLPPAFNRRSCVVYYRGNGYSNEKAKRMLGWTPKVGTIEGIRRHCEYFKSKSN